jgi:hypothetical protein
MMGTAAAGRLHVRRTACCPMETLKLHTGRSIELVKLQTKCVVLGSIIETALLHVHITHNFLRHRISVIMRERADGVFFRLDKASLKVALSGKLSVFFGLDVGSLDILRLWTCASTCACTSLRLSLRGWRRACIPRLH